MPENWNGCWRPVIYFNINLINKYRICVLDQNMPVHQTSIILTLN